MRTCCLSVCACVRACVSARVCLCTETKAGSSEQRYTHYHSGLIFGPSVRETFISAL